MTFTCSFTVTLDNYPVSNGILVYQTNLPYEVHKKISEDYLDSSGYVKVEWGDALKNETIEVFCHTDGRKSGIPAYVHTLTLVPGRHYNLTAEPGVTGRWRGR